jgi:hypothetical protein
MILGWGAQGKAMRSMIALQCLNWFSRCATVRPLARAPEAWGRQGANPRRGVLKP